MDKAVKAICLGFVISYIWLIFPQGVFIKPFLVTDIEITIQEYVDYAATRVLFVIFALIIRSFYRSFQTDLICVLFVGYLIDYLVSYNDPYAKIHLTNGYFIPISYPLFMGLILIFYATTQNASRPLR